VQEATDLVLVLLHLLEGLAIHVSNLIGPLKGSHPLSEFSEGSHKDIVFLHNNLMVLPDVFNLRPLLGELSFLDFYGFVNHIPLFLLVESLILESILQVLDNLFSSPGLLEVIFQSGIDLIRVVELLSQVSDLIVYILELLLQGSMSNISLLNLPEHMHILLSQIFNLQFLLRQELLIALFHLLHLCLEHLHLAFQILSELVSFKQSIILRLQMLIMLDLHIELPLQIIIFMEVLLDLPLIFVNLVDIFPIGVTLPGLGREA
jgi:hypothetical protein